MSAINSTQLLAQLNWRYATKQFDPNRKISALDLAALEEALLLTASSGGLQPWKFVVVTDPAVRAKLRPAAYGQAVEYPLAPKRHAWVHVAEGEVSVNGTKLTGGDAIGVSDETLLKISAAKPSQVLLFDLN